MLGLIIVVLFGLAMAGFLIGVIVINTKSQANGLGDRIAQADELIAKARYWRENPQSSSPVVVVAVKPTVQPIV